MVLNRGPLDWESSTLTTGPLGRKKVFQRLILVLSVVGWLVVTLFYLMSE